MDFPSQSQCLLKKRFDRHPLWVNCILWVLDSDIQRKHDVKITLLFLLEGQITQTSQYLYWEQYWKTICRVDATKNMLLWWRFCKLFVVWHHYWQNYVLLVVPSYMHLHLKIHSCYVILWLLSDNGAELSLLKAPDWHEQEFSAALQCEKFLVCYGKWSDLKFGRLLAWWTSF